MIIYSFFELVLFEDVGQFLEGGNDAQEQLQAVLTFRISSRQANIEVEKFKNFLKKLNLVQISRPPSGGLCRTYYGYNPQLPHIRIFLAQLQDSGIQQQG